MQFKIAKLANLVENEDEYIYSRLIALASKIQKMRYIQEKPDPKKRRDRPTLLLDPNIMVGLIYPSEVLYKDEIGKVEIDYD